jgi:hypothetical protein
VSRESERAYLRSGGWLRRDFGGRVDVTDDAWVVTEFDWVVVPVRARASYYVQRDGDGGTEWIEIPRHRASVAAGLLRTTSWLLTLGCGLGAIAGEHAPWWTGIVAVVAALVAAWSTWSLGRLSRDERERRALLRRVVGIGAPPDLLPPAQVILVRQQLDSAWNGRQRGSWQDAVLAGVGDELLVALAEYHQRDALAEKARANLTATDSDLN